MKTEHKEINDVVISGEDDWIKAIRSQLKSLRFGVVQIVVHDSRVVQIERTEKIRLDRNEGKNP